MDLVTLAAVCAIGWPSDLFVPLGLPPDCSPAVQQPPSPRPSGGRADVSSWAPIVDEAARRFALPDRLLRAVMQIESAGDPAAVSPKGAMGLMQLMPDTYATMRARYALGADPFDPHDNVIAGAAFLRELRDRYSSPDFLAAYNAGSGRLDDYLATGRPLPDETLQFVSAVQLAIGTVAFGRQPISTRPANPVPTSMVENGQRDSLFIVLRAGNEVSP